VTAAVLDVESTGTLDAVVWPPAAAGVTRADDKIALHVAILADLPRDPLDGGIVCLPGVRYRIGGLHPTAPFSRYLHRLPS
jgi:hypothetical protein